MLDDCPAFLIMLDVKAFMILKWVANSKQQTENVMICFDLFYDDVCRCVMCVCVRCPSLAKGLLRDRDLGGEEVSIPVRYGTLRYHT